MTEQPEIMPHRSHKDTRRWCKGVPGREHKTDIRRNRAGFTCGRPSWSVHRDWWCWHERYCTVCEKVLVHHLSEAECPDAGSP